ncbi:hypothetical protein IQ06DRAFT_54868 [Phaeosphaeriaceae sp. SRC1lsM3a]|nr:hypothetical protein IQ06DRAFT_54868 [Stagonospora sp. SRC1lsM3a]
MSKPCVMFFKMLSVNTSAFQALHILVPLPASSFPHGTNHMVIAGADIHLHSTRPTNFTASFSQLYVTAALLPAVNPATPAVSPVASALPCVYNASGPRPALFFFSSLCLLA